MNKQKISCPGGFVPCGRKAKQMNGHGATEINTDDTSLQQVLKDPLAVETAHEKFIEIVYLGDAAKQAGWSRYGRRARMDAMQLPVLRLLASLAAQLLSKTSLKNYDATV